MRVEWSLLCVVSVLSTLALGLAVASCDAALDPTASPTRDECRRARERAVDLQLHLVGDRMETDERRREVRLKHRKNLLASSAGAQYLDYCEENRTVAFVSCSLAADNLAAYRACEKE